MEITKKHNSAHPTRSGRNGNIDLMRFVFCLIIILYHINNRLDCQKNIFRFAARAE